MEDKKNKKSLKKDGYKLIADFPTKKKNYVSGDTIQLTKEGADYLRNLKKIK